MSFVADLAEGEAGERRLLERLTTVFPECEFIKASKKSKYMDCICLMHGERIEVKTDRMAEKTGNVCFEWKLFEHTKAEDVCYLIGDKAYCWPTEQLKNRLLELTAQGKVRGQMGGDGWRTALILAPMKHITATATIYELEDEAVV